MRSTEMTKSHLWTQLFSWKGGRIFLLFEIEKWSSSIHRLRQRNIPNLNRGNKKTAAQDVPVYHFDIMRIVRFVNQRLLLSFSPFILGKIQPIIGWHLFDITLWTLQPLRSLPLMRKIYWVTLRRERVKGDSLLMTTSEYISLNLSPSLHPPPNSKCLIAPCKS